MRTVFFERVKIDGFGKLQGRFEFQPGVCNIICQENEFGKSTLVDAILHTLYRFPVSSAAGHLRHAARYQPWKATQTGAYRVELTLRELHGRDYVVGCDFDERQQFHVSDAETGEDLPLTDTCFGRQLFAMPLHVFTQCFFLRQDEGHAPANDDLIQLIESAAAVTHRVHQVPANSALDRLTAFRLGVPELGTEPMAAEQSVSGLERRIEDCEAALAELEAERAKAQPRIEEADALAAEASRIQSDQREIEHALAFADLLEIERMLEWQEKQANGGADLEALLGRFDPELKPRLQVIRDRIHELQGEAREKRRRLDEDIVEGLRRLREREDENQGSVSLSPGQLQRLRAVRATVMDRHREIETHRAQVEEMRQKLTAQGLTPDSYDQMKRICEHLPPGDSRILLEYDARSGELEAKLGEAQKVQSEAASRVLAARGERQKLRAKSTMFLMGAVLFAAFSVLFFIMKPVWKPALAAAIVSLTVSGAAVVVGWLKARATQAYNSAHLEPALAEEIRTSSDTRKLAEQLDNLRLAFKETVQRLHLSWDDTQFVRRVGRWSDSLVPYHAAEQYLTRLEKGFDEMCQEVRRDLAEFGVELSTEEIAREGVLDQAITRLENGIDTNRQREELDREGAELVARIEEIESLMREDENSILEILGKAEGDDPIEMQVQEYLAGCDRVEALRSMADGDPGIGLPPPEELRERATNLRQRIAEEWADCNGVAPELEGQPRSSLEQCLRDLKTRGEETLAKREQAFAEGDTAISRWRSEAIVLRSQKARLALQRERALGIQASVERAQGILREAITTTLVNWTSALNEKVAEILPGLNTPYSDLQFSEAFEISVYSQDHGRRLAPSEVMCLSKGARDQLSLAVRVAISEFVASHVGNLPIVLDEPFAHWDDSRFVEGMKFLVSLAKRHQVLLLSCHKWRYEELERRHPELAGELRFCDMMPINGDLPQAVSNSLQ